MSVFIYITYEKAYVCPQCHLVESDKCLSTLQPYILCVSLQEYDDFHPVTVRIVDVINKFSYTFL